MLLSACDTHAADRNHATVANGFLSLGVRTVVASVFPLDARDAAAFTGRLLHRIANFIPLTHSILERSVTWMEMLSGLLRMQFLTDYLRLLSVVMVFGANGGLN
ncbi:CHAT domain-containing protein [uncultured Tateyamaria sp.]|uniref:CHAT domain-containing protein n=1 Tax=uncultured Tateyamaria sp. TaxID=455651 RepID=UPI00341E29F0